MGSRALSTLIYMVFLRFHVYVPSILLNQRRRLVRRNEPEIVTLFRELAHSEAQWVSANNCQSLTWQYGKQVISMYININIYKYVYKHRYIHMCLYHVVFAWLFLISTHACHINPTHKSMTHYCLVPSEALPRAEIIFEGHDAPLANGRERARKSDVLQANAQAPTAFEPARPPSADLA